MNTKFTRVKRAAGQHRLLHVIRLLGTYIYHSLSQCTQQARESTQQEREGTQQTREKFVGWVRNSTITSGTLVNCCNLFQGLEFAGLFITMYRHIKYPLKSLDKSRAIPVPISSFLLLRYIPQCEQPK